MVFDSGGCGGDVNARSFGVDLGLLAIGEYKVTAEYATLAWSGRFVVRNAAAPPASVSMSGGTAVTLGRIRNVQAVDFGGTPVTNMRTENDMVVVTAPAHAPGLYDLTIKTSDYTAKLEGGIYYFDPSRPPDRTMFEPVLFPVLDSAGGAFGSRWTATATIMNASIVYVETFNRIDGIACIDRPCMELRPPQSIFDVEGSGDPHGAILYAPRGAMQYGLRVRETSRSDDPGVEIGAIRESRFAHESLTLANVPASDAYRTKVRIYGLDPDPAPFVFASIVVDGKFVTSIQLPLARGGDPSQGGYAEFDLQPLLKGRGDRAILFIGSTKYATLWAFASAVHNVSQKLVVIAPQ